MRFKSSLLAAAVLGLAVSAHADMLTFNFTTTGTFTDVNNDPPSTVTSSGTFTLDTTLGQITSFYATDSLGAVYDSDNDLFQSNTEPASPPYVSDIGLDDVSFSNYPFVSVYTFAIYNPTPETYAICEADSPCETLSQESFGFIESSEPDAGVQVTGATLSAAPEPSSLVLLATGVLSIAGAARRKFFNR